MTSCRWKGLSIGVFVAASACGSPALTPVAESRAPASSVLPPSTAVPEPIAAPVSTSAPAVEPARTKRKLDDIDEYRDCAEARIVASAAGPADLAKARSAGWLWPERCGAVPGWAGIGISLADQATGFSKDGTQFIVCGVAEDCLVVSLRRAAVDRRVRPSRPNGRDGQPVTKLPEIAKLFRDLGAPATDGAFAYADDLRVSWSLAPDALTLDVSLLELSTGTEIPIHHFPGNQHDSTQPIVLTKARLSPSGTVLELDVFTGQGGSGFDVALVNLDAEAARLFRKMADSDPSHRETWNAKADAASKKATAFAATFGASLSTLGSPRTDHRR